MAELIDTFVPSLSPHPSVIPQGTTSIPIASISLWPEGAIPSLFTFPGKLDVDRLIYAIGLLSEIYPSICGRFEKHPKEAGEVYDFSFDLTQSPIPLSIQHLTDDDTAQEQALPGTSPQNSRPFPDNSIVQPSLDPHLPPLGAKFRVPNSDSFLFAVRLTYLQNGGSILGINWAHILGDGQACLNAIKWLEAFYLHREQALRNYLEMGLVFPNYFPHVKLPEYNANLGLRNNEVQGVDTKEMWERYTKSWENTHKISIYFTQAEIDQLRSAVVQSLEHNLDQVKLSDQDILSGWWIDLHRRAGIAINEATYVCNYRRYCTDHSSVPLTLPGLVGNASQMPHFFLLDTTTPNSTKETPSYRDILLIAKKLRKEISTLQSNPDALLPFLANQAHHLQKAAEEGKGQVLAPGDGDCFINSNIRMSWQLGFGFPANQTAYHTIFSTQRFLRVFPANPEPGEGAPLRRVELIFRVPEDKLEVFGTLLKHDHREWVQ